MGCCCDCAAAGQAVDKASKAVKSRRFMLAPTGGQCDRVKWAGKKVGTTGVEVGAATRVVCGRPPVIQIPQLLMLQDRPMRSLPLRIIEPVSNKKIASGERARVIPGLCTTGRRR